MNPDNAATLRAIFRSVFELSDDVDPEALNAQDEPKWDSLATVMLIAAMESEFQVTVDAAEALQLDSFGAAQALLDGNGL